MCRVLCITAGEAAENCCFLAFVSETTFKTCTNTCGSVRSQTWCHFAPRRKGTGRRVESPSLPFHVRWSSEHIPPRHHRERVISRNEKTQLQDSLSLSLQCVWKRWNKKKGSRGHHHKIRYNEALMLVREQVFGYDTNFNLRLSLRCKTKQSFKNRRHFVSSTASIYSPDRKLCHKKDLKLRGQQIRL